METTLTVLENTTTSNIEICKIQVNEGYLKEWRESSRDFLVFAKEGKLLRNTLYRKGGLTSASEFKNKYFVMLKYVEEEYDLDFLKRCHRDYTPEQLEKEKKHLASYWVIIDSNGNERKVFDRFSHPYLIKHSCLYHFENKLYNIETGQCYGSSYSYLESSEYVIIKGEKDTLSQINKETGKSITIK
jgi:hypothetical protein